MPTISPRRRTSDDAATPSAGISPVTSSATAAAGSRRPRGGKSIVSGRPTISVIRRSAVNAAAASVAT